LGDGVRVLHVLDGLNQEQRASATRTSIVGVTWSKDGRKTNKISVVSFDWFCGCEKRAKRTTLAEFAICCVILPRWIGSKVVVLLSRENGWHFCADPSLALCSIAASRFLSRFSPC
jgi:hypothetical protein